MNPQQLSGKHVGHRIEAWSNNAEWRLIATLVAVAHQLAPGDDTADPKVVTDVTLDFGAGEPALVTLAPDSRVQVPGLVE